MSTLVNILIALLIFGLIVAIHEFGHFLLAKANGIGVVEFSLGMGPRLASFVKGGTRYSLKAFPIGGSCMMLGEEEDSEDPRAFHNKGVWARISVIFAGPLFNFILAFLLALIIIGKVGYDPALLLDVSEDGPAQAAGLQQGDLITEVNGTNITIGRELSLFYEVEGLDGTPLTITYERDGAAYETELVPEFIKNYMTGIRYNNNESPAVLVEVVADYPMEAAGVKAGDEIIAINDTEITSGAAVSQYFSANPLDETPLTFTLSRDGAPYSVTITPIFVSEGYSVGMTHNLYRVNTNVLGVLKYSLNEVKYVIVSTIKSLGMLITGKLGAENLGGPVRIVNEIGNVVEASKDDGTLYVVLNLLNWSVLLSANLGVMNLLPIPALDGGRLLFLFVEAIRRKPVDRNKEGIVNLIGFVLLMLLMVFVFFNDIKNIFFA